MSRRIVSVVAVIAVIVMSAPQARAQTGIGVRYGNIAVEGDHISMDAENAKGVIGAHLALGFLPFINVQLGVEVLKGDATYNYPLLGEKEGEFNSFSIIADFRYPVKLFPVFPLKPVVGGGMNYNMMSYLDESAIGTTSPTADDFSHLGYHWMLGLQLKFPMLPFTVTGEYRSQTIKLEDDTIVNNGLLFTLTFGF